MVLAHDTLSHCALVVHEVSLNSFNSVQRTERTKMYLVMLHGELLKNKQARVMVLLLDTSSECAFQIYEVSLKYQIAMQMI